MAPARRVFRGLRAGVLLALIAGSQAGAQDKPRLRPKPLPEASDRAADGNSLPDLNTTTAPDLPGSPPGSSTKPAKPTTFVVAPAAPLLLRSAVHSRYSHAPTIARSTTGQCRAQCAEQRTQCASGSESETSNCDPGWTRCLSTCDGLSYSRGP